MKSIFPATYSSLCPVALSELIAQKYNLENVQCSLLVRGVGDTYLVEVYEGRYILRVYRADHRSLAQVQTEVALLLALKEAGVSVSYPIPGIDGTAILQLNAIEGTRHAVLFSYAPGQAVRILEDHQLRIFGREMARFHNVSSAIRLETARWDFNSSTTLFGPLKKLAAAFTTLPEAYAWLQQAAERADKKLAQLLIPGCSRGYCHFDFLPKNFHFEGDAIVFFDFDFMGYGWLVNDIMSFWQHLSLDVYAGRMSRQAADDAYAVFLEGYREHRALQEQELAAVPYLSLGFWLFYMSFHTTHDQFYAFVQPAQLKVFTDFLKHMVAVYWDKDLREHT